MTERAPRYRPIMMIAPALLVSGCLQPMDDFPSLARRDVELRDRQAEALAPPPPIEAVADPALARELKGVLDKAEDAQETFAVARSAAQQATAGARNAPVGSEAWSVAQTRISTLESSRRQLTELLGDLEALYTARLVQEADGKVKAGGSGQIDQTRKFVLQLVEAQDKVINDLKANLAG